MDISTENGIICSKDEEKELVKRINTFLTKEYNYRKMYKWKDDIFKKYNYDYYYCQYIRIGSEQPRWSFDLRPNEDLDGKRRFNNKDVNWILFINKLDVDKNTIKQNEEVNTFFEKLLKVIKFSTIVLHKYKDMEERVGTK
jgi:hypothetical protein